MTNSDTKSQSRDISFLRKRDYQMVRELGQGACGKTVLLLDDVIDEHLVCKKYFPYDEAKRKELFSNFVREIKLLHQLHHENVVRVFNYYIYPDDFTGYILMEFVDGLDIQEHVEKHPEHINQLFLQAVSGFSYMETMGVLHRDIRPMNLMVNSEGALKIIDLGFGKRIEDSTDFDKSISLNWWCNKPAEFDDKKYDFTTEVYFVGKLFDKLILENSIGDFQHNEILQKMCVQNPAFRVSSFNAVTQFVRANRFNETRFSSEQIDVYRSFADILFHCLEKIRNDTKYIDDIQRIQRELEDAYRAFMLMTSVPDSAVITECFVDGSYHYRKNCFGVRVVKDFLNLLKTCSTAQARIILANLHTGLDAVKRYSRILPPDDEIPF